MSNIFILCFLLSAIFFFNLNSFDRYRNALFLPLAVHRRRILLGNLAVRYLSSRSNKTVFLSFDATRIFLSQSAHPYPNHSVVSTRYQLTSLLPKILFGFANLLLNTNTNNGYRLQAACTFLHMESKLSLTVPFQKHSGSCHFRFKFHYRFF